MAILLNLGVIDVPRPNLEGTKLPDMSQPAVSKKVLLAWTCDSTVQMTVIIDPDEAESIARKLVLTANECRGKKILGVDAKGRPKP